MKAEVDLLGHRYGLLKLALYMQKLQVAHGLEQEKERRKTSDLLVVQVMLANSI
jgi:hypothetical protein